MHPQETEHKHCENRYINAAGLQMLATIGQLDLDHIWHVRNLISLHVMCEIP